MPSEPDWRRGRQRDREPPSEETWPGGRPMGRPYLDERPGGMAGGGARQPDTYGQPDGTWYRDTRLDDTPYAATRNHSTPYPGRGTVWMTQDFSS